VLSALEGDHATLRSHLREANRIGELCSQGCKVGLGHPTGDRTGASDVHRYLEVPHLLYELSEWREAYAVHSVDQARFDKARRLA
jgi:hypothetical protein